MIVSLILLLVVLGVFYWIASRWIKQDPTRVQYTKYLYIVLGLILLAGLITMWRSGSFA